MWLIARLRHYFRLPLFPLAYNTYVHTLNHEGKKVKKLKSLIANYSPKFILWEVLNIYG